MVFYFTGTGNSLYAAKNLDTETVSIPRIMHRKQWVFEANKIGIVCPIYMYEMPAMVKSFIRRATFHANYLYVVLTYGASQANAVELANDAFKDAKKSADYITTLLMADNFLPAFDMSEQARLDKDVDGQLDAIKANILAKKRMQQAVTLSDRQTHQGHQHLVGSAATTVWATFRVTDTCIGCGICTKVCPAGCIRLEGQKAVYTNKSCQTCFACIHACSNMAIQLNLPEKNTSARYRHVHIALSEIIEANNQTEN